MREIRFRAWHENNQDFIYATLKSIWMNGWSCCEALESPKLPKEKDGIFTTQEALKNYGAFEPNANWEMFTGLKDKNGKGAEIYKDDLIHAANSSLIGVVVYDTERGQWWVYEQNRPLLPLHEALSANAFKCGNIHEKPELLETERKENG